MLDLIPRQIEALGHTPATTVTMGSSMGATGALKFGLLLGLKGIVAIGPHIDLDICAERQGRWRHVAAIVADGDPVSPGNREVPASSTAGGALAPATCATPPLHAGVSRRRRCFSRAGRPLCRDWAAAGGSVTRDARRTGGHTSDHATRALLLDWWAGSSTTSRSMS